MTVGEIKKKASELFTEYLDHTIDCICSGINEKSDVTENFFPLDILTNKSRFSDTLKEHSKEMVELYLHSKNKNGVGYSLEMESINTRSNGRKSIIKRVYFAEENDYLDFVNVKSRVDNLKAALAVLSQDEILPAAQLKTWAKKHVRDLTTVQNEPALYWHSIAQCAIWLKNNQNASVLPMHISADFIDSNKKLLQSFSMNQESDIQIPELLNSPEAQPVHPKQETTKSSQQEIESVADENVLAIKSKPFSIRFRSLSIETPIKLGRLAPKEIALTLDDFIHLNQTNFLKEITTVLIVNSETIFQTFPNSSHVLCIYGPDYAVNALKLCDWFGQVQIIYYGDISEHCFDVLSAFRNSWPKTESLCMDGNTWEKFFTLAENGAHLKNNTIPKNLTTPEKNTFLSLRLSPEKSKLPQEKITIEYASQYLEAIKINNSLYESSTPSVPTETVPESKKAEQQKTDKSAKENISEVKTEVKKSSVKKTKEEN